MAKYVILEVVSFSASCTIVKINSAVVQSLIFTLLAISVLYHHLYNYLYANNTCPYSSCSMTPLGKRGVHPAVVSAKVDSNHNVLDNYYATPCS